MDWQTPIDSKSDLFYNYSIGSRRGSIGFQKGLCRFRLMSHTYYVSAPMRERKAMVWVWGSKIIGKIIGEITKIIIAIVGPFMVDLYFIVLQARNSKFHDFGIFEPVTKPQNQLF